MSRLIFGWLTAGIASLPPWLGYALADMATGIHWLAFPGRRHNVMANLAVILPRASRGDRARVARRMMRSYNRMMYEFFRLPHVSREELLASVEVVGKEHLESGHRARPRRDPRRHPHRQLGAGGRHGGAVGLHAACGGRRAAVALAVRRRARHQDRAVHHHRLARGRLPQAPAGARPQRPGRADGGWRPLRARPHGRVLRPRHALPRRPRRAGAAHRRAAAVRLLRAHHARPLPHRHRAAARPGRVRDHRRAAPGGGGHRRAPHPLAHRPVVHLPAAVGRTGRTARHRAPRSRRAQNTRPEAATCDENRHRLAVLLPALRRRHRARALTRRTSCASAGTRSPSSPASSAAARRASRTACCASAGTCWCRSIARSWTSPSASRSAAAQARHPRAGSRHRARALPDRADAAHLRGPGQRPAHRRHVPLHRRTHGTAGFLQAHGGRGDVTSRRAHRGEHDRQGDGRDVPPRPLRRDPERRRRRALPPAAWRRSRSGATRHSRTSCSWAVSIRAKVCRT